MKEPGTFEGTLWSPQPDDVVIKVTPEAVNRWYSALVDSIKLNTPLRWPTIESNPAAPSPDTADRAET